MARLKENDLSEVLRELAKKVGTVTSVEVSEEVTELNIYEMTVINGKETDNNDKTPDSRRALYYGRASYPAPKPLCERKPPSPVYRSDRTSYPAPAPSPAPAPIPESASLPVKKTPKPAPCPVKENNDYNLLGSFFLPRRTRKEVSIGSANELMRLERSVEVIEVKSNSCNDRELRVLDLSRFVNLREFIVGEKCFEYVKRADLIGLNRLERVVIGKHSFPGKSDKDKDEKSRFCVKRCERLKELKIGCMSFFGYNVCEIENDDSLEVIEIGEMNELLSCNFMFSSFLMKSEYNEMKS